MAKAVSTFARSGITEYVFPGGRITRDGGQFDTDLLWLKSQKAVDGQVIDIDYQSPVIVAPGNDFLAFIVELERPAYIVATGGTCPSRGTPKAFGFLTDDITTNDNSEFQIAMPYFHPKAIRSGYKSPVARVLRVELTVQQPDGRMLNNGIFQLPVIQWEPDPIL